MAEETFDAIVVGAGMAGNAAAYRLAQAGLQVVIVERGPFPGSKNLSGGVLYGRVLHQLIPEYWKEAPVERYITNEIITFLTGEASFNIDFKTQAFAEPPYNGFTVLRSKFDRWFAEKAEAAGAMLVSGIKVDGVLREDGRAVGVAAGGEEIRANVVIMADGANSFLAQEAGLHEKIPTNQLALGVKQVIGLPRATIEERFHLTGSEGAAYSLVGSISGGVTGGGFLYTNLESLSVGLVMNLDELVEGEMKPPELLEQFLAHPTIAPLVKDGKPLEYGAHLVAEGGIAMMPRLYTDGMLVTGDAAGFSVNNGFLVRGMDLAIGSGIAAAETVIEAKARNDFSAASLSAYQRRLEASAVMADLKTYANTPRFLKNERLYQGYPEMLAGLMTQIYRQEALPKEHLMQMVMKSLKQGHVSLFDLVKDGFTGVRTL
jgi:electron transfer flavoprotein-quinone oxidoreductase